METMQMAEWLMEVGSPAIRCWIERNVLTRRTTGRADDSFNDVLHNPITRQWLELICLTGIHGSNPSCLENLAPKLSMLGFRPDHPEFQERCNYWLDRIDVSIFKRRTNEVGGNSPPIGLWSFTFFHNAIIAGVLGYVGFSTHPRVAQVLESRLETVYSTISREEFDPNTFYLQPADYTRLPKSRQHDVVNPAYYQYGNFKLPWIHDILGFIGMYRSTIDASTLTKIEGVIDFVLSPAYQQLVDGYGVVKTKENQAYAMGWSVHLPCYLGGFGENTAMMSTAKLLLMLDLMSYFKTVRNHPWYRNAISFLERYRDVGSRYLFPREFVDERPSGYWVNGAYMGMGENHADVSWRESLSTFWMLRILLKH